MFYNYTMEINFIHDPDEVKDGYRLLDEYRARVYLKRKNESRDA